MDNNTEEALSRIIEQALVEDGAVVTTLRSAFHGVLAIYAFGSRIQGTASIESDLDLSILMAGYADPMQLWEMANSLSEVVHCPVDLFDLRAASTVMQFQVITRGKLLWAKQPAARLFECHVLDEKFTLDEGRAGILKDITIRGSVYAR
jgi:predicted nucleotidyltransferase